MGDFIGGLIIWAFSAVILFWSAVVVVTVVHYIWFYIAPHIEKSMGLWLV